jgi:hemolysin activation/secretion protein
MNLRIALTALALVISAAPVPAASLPDAGSLLRQQEPQRTLPQQLPTIEKPAERPVLSDSGVQVTVAAIRFSGFEGLATEAELQALVAPAVGKKLVFAELQALTDRVTTHLKNKGWFLARAYLPRQDVSAGIIEIAIINGALDRQSKIDIKQPARIRSEVLHGLIEKQIRPGQPIHTADIERAVFLMNDLPGVLARATVEPGSKTGTSNIVVNVSEGPVATGYVWSDNQGSRYTGEWRGNGMLLLNDLTGYGDQVSLMMTGAQGLYQGKAGYTFPLGSNGLKANLAYTGMHYELSGPLQNMNGGGDASTMDTGLSYPIIRSRTLNLNSSIGFSYKLLYDYMAGVSIRNKNLQIGTIGLSGDIYDRILGGGYNSWQLGAIVGNLDLTGNSIDYQGDQLTAKANGSYAKITYSFNRLQRLTDSLSLAGSYSGQYALDNLDSSEKFNLGGPSGVRAYPTGEGSGDTGGIFTAELRYNLPLPAKLVNCQLFGFYDAGHITLHETVWPNSVATVSGKNSYWLQGAGIGLSFSSGSLLSIRATWAHTIGDNPGRGLNGKDADGRAEQNRFWLQTMFYF